MTHTANRATHANTHDRVVVINDQAMKNCSKTMKGKHTLLNRKHVAQYIFYDISLLWYLWICTHVLWLPIKEFYGIYPYSGAASNPRNTYWYPFSLHNYAHTVHYVSLLYPYKEAPGHWCYDNIKLIHTGILSSTWLTRTVICIFLFLLPHYPLFSVLTLFDFCILI